MGDPWRSRLDETISSGQIPRWDVASYPPLVAKFLQARGYQDPQQVDLLLSPKVSDLKDPLSMIGMDAAVGRLIQAYRLQEKVCIYADFDLDGTSGLALLNEGFKRLGFKDFVAVQPKRLVDGYGFHSHIVEELAAQGVKLIITVDVGITAFAACLKARELGIEVIVTDHHQPAETLPEALTVVNPNRRDCTSGLGYLCGAGVAFYLLRAIKRGLLNEGLIDESSLDLKSVLDCFAIGTLTDMVPLVEDNRVLVKMGLKQLEQTQRAGLRALLKALGLNGRPLSSQDVAIRFAPKLNALSRMELGILPLDLLLVENADEAEKLVEKVLEHNSTRVQLQANGEQEAFEFLKTWPHEDFFVMASKQFHRGVIGLIATKVSQQTGVPAFVGSVDESGHIVGSARRAPGDRRSLLSAFEFASEHLIRFGGHDAAAGFELLVENKDAFIEKLKEFYFQASELDAVVLTYDAEADLNEVNPQFMKWMDAMGPFGHSFEVPLFCFRYLSVKDRYHLKGGHLKYRLQDQQTGKKIEALYFSPPSETSHFEKDQIVDVVGEVQWNYFAGQKDLQILIKDIRAGTKA